MENGNPTIITRYFNNLKIIESEKEIMISDYALPQLDEALKKIQQNIPNNKDMYILCPKKINKVTQIAMTETIKIYNKSNITESFKDAAIEGVREELRLNCNSQDMKEIHESNGFDRKSRLIQTFYYSCPINKTSITSNFVERDGIDNNHKKACIIVYGTYDEIKSKMRSYKKSTDLNDNIIAVVAIKLSDAIKITDKLIENGRVTFLWQNN